MPQSLRRFLYIPDLNASSLIFSEKFDTEEEFLKHLRGSSRFGGEGQLSMLSSKLANLRKLSTKLAGMDIALGKEKLPSFDLGEEDEDDDEEEDFEEEDLKKPLPKKKKK